MTTSRNIVDERASWFFFSGGPGAPRYGDDPTKHAVDHDTESFVREVLQNANDQALDGDDPVEVTFRFRSLVGDDRERFLEALRWGTGFRDRLASVAADGRTRGYDRFLERLDDPDEPLRLLVVEDRNTTGLTGSWDEDSNYAALVRDELYSSKQTDTAGGSYGLGKSVLWTFSAASTVLFNSYPVTTRDDRSPPRVVGRTKLPTHERDGVTYQGAGWLCSPRTTPSGPRPESLWGDTATELAERLHVDRPAVSGTSAMVVGYRDPTRDARPELDELADEFVEAAVKYFWPALYRGDLRVTVETPDETREADVGDVPSIQPFVDCFESRDIDGETLEEPGDVAGLDLPLDVPRRADGDETPKGTVRLAARLASPADDDAYQNHVALFRGAGMVVKYYDQRRIAFGDRNFHAVLACGDARTAASTTAADREVDRFLRFAEPPEHDDWESTENLREHYRRGFRTAIDEMFGSLRDGLRHLVARSTGTGDALSDRVLKRFPIHGGRTRRRSIRSPGSVFDIETESTFDDDRWTFEGRIAPVNDAFESWTADVSMVGVGEDGSTYDTVSVASVEAAHDDVETHTEDGTGQLVAGETATDVEFHGMSDRVEATDTESVRVGETRLEVRAELVTPEED